MAIITLPDDLIVNRQTWGEKRFDLRFQSGDSGAGQSRILAPARWTCSLAVTQELDRARAAVWRALILDMKGQINQLAVYDRMNPAPLGTLRGAVTLSAAAAAGALVLAITAGAGQAGATLLRGDWLGIGAGSARQLVSVAADVTLNGAGAGTVAIQQPVRWAQASGAAVVWDRPTALCRLTTDANSWQSQAMNQSGFTLDLQESWE